jgi:hypothetical protein
MIKFIIDKIRDNDGPLKSARLVVGDIVEEAVDIASHYIKKIRGRSDSISAPPFAEEVPSTNDSPSKTYAPNTKNASFQKNKSAGRPKKSGAAKKSKSSDKKLKRTVDVPPELATALDKPANQRKQEFKVLAILWDAQNRNQSGMSAKDLSEHGIKLGLSIRHENIRKVIKMRLSAYVEILQEVNSRSSIYHYRLNDAGDQYFRDNYLQ